MAKSEEVPTPRGNVVTTHCFVEFDHAGDKYTRIYQTWVLIFVNKDPIIWYSKRHNTVDNSTFSGKFIFIKTTTELVEALWYKLRMFDIPIEGPTNMFCNNEAVYKNASTPELILKKKNVSICYHKFKEAVSNGVNRIAKEGKATNLADLFTKMLVQTRRKNLLDKFTY